MRPSFILPLICSSSLLASSAFAQEAPAPAAEPAPAPVAATAPAAAAPAPVAPAPAPAGTPAPQPTAAAAAVESPAQATVPTDSEDPPQAEAKATEDESEDSAPTLLGDKKSGKVHIGGFGGPTLLGTSINGQAGMLAGAEGGVVFDRRLSLGLAGYGLVTEVNGPQFPVSGNDSVFGLAYGGFMMRYQFGVGSPVYASIGGLIGPGAFTLVEKLSDTDYEWDEENPHGSIFLVAEPSLQVHANFTQWMRAGLVASYRFVHGVDVYGMDSSDLRGPSFGANLQFGWF